MAYIDINSGLHEYPATMTEFENDYIQMKDFQPYSLSGTVDTTSRKEDACRTACNNDPLCAGYTYTNSVCRRYTETNIYPKGNRILDEGKITHIRKKKITANPTNSSHFTCNKFINNVDSAVYTSYPETSNMNPQQKCALGLILEPRMAELQTKNTAAVDKGKEIKGSINRVYTNQNELKETKANVIFSGGVNNGICINCSQ